MNKRGLTMKELFTLNINCYETNEVTCGDTTYRQILFDGFAKGPHFNGRILNGGADTQTIKKDGSGTLSARYMLEGTDASGDPCKIFVENTAVIGDDTTHPHCVSDSPELAWLEKAVLIGKMVRDSEGFKIIFFYLTSESP